MSKAATSPSSTDLPKEMCSGESNPWKEADTMYSLSWVLRLAAAVCFGLAIVGVPSRLNLVSLGLCLFALSSVVA